MLRRAVARGLLALAAVGSVQLVGGAAPAVADVPCELNQTRYISQSSYALASLAVPQSWRLATGKGVTVAVVDSGVDAGNAHLAGAVLRGTSFVPGDPSGRTDVLGHGTAVAGIIAGRYLPAQKSALIGVAPDAHVLPVRVFQDQATDGRQVAFPPSTLRTAQGIRWAVEHGADVINVSISTRPQDSDVPALRSAVELAHRHDVVVVASGGNALGTALTQQRYPAGLPHVIGVAAANVSGVVDDWSVHGPQNDVAAPGSDVLIAFHHNGDCLGATEHPETSWAAPFVAGLAAQLRERFPHESADQIAYRISASADRPVQDRRDDVSGWGLIQPYAALTMTIDPGRPGPPLPGASAAPAPAVARTPVRPLAATSDPLAPTRRAALWWGLLGVGVAALAVVLRPWVRRVRAAPPTS
jgi:membrane-anchored mycosin MYCP